MPVKELSTVMQTIGNYDLTEKIAEGGIGTVYRGRNHLTGEVVAVKVVPPHLLTNPVVLRRFEQEYLVARSIDHPNIVKALDFGREGETRYLVMEFVDGETVGQRLERDGRMSEADAIRIISQVALGLQNAHKKGMIHRDVKPDNILITQDGHVKLTDLGLVKEIDADLNLTRTGRGLGTPHFMSPEQFRNAKKADVRCDIYSLGATLYMMVTGDLPFKSNGPLDAWMKKINNEIEPPRQLAPDLSERVDWAIRRAISPDPAHRPENCREFIEDLTGHSTKQLTSTDHAIDSQNSYWYLVYTDEDSVIHTVKGTIKGIRRSLKEGLLGDTENIRIAATKEGPFEPLKQVPELRDLVIQPATLRKSDTAVNPALLSSPGSSSTSASATCDSGILTTTCLTAPVLDAKVTPKAPVGPVINLVASQRPPSTDLFKWIVFGTIFAGAGALATLYLPSIFRHVRF